jgi:hypothetical protein
MLLAGNVGGCAKEAGTIERITQSLQPTRRRARGGQHHEKPVTAACWTASASAPCLFLSAALSCHELAMQGGSRAEQLWYCALLAALWQQPGLSPTLVQRGPSGPDPGTWEFEARCCAWAAVLTAILAGGLALAKRVQF